MGHAGAIVGGADDTAAAKMKIMAACGIHVVASPADIGKTMAEVLKFPANKHPWTTPGSSPGAEGEAARVTRESNRGRGLTQLRIDKLTRTGATYCVHDAAQPGLSLRVSAGG